MKSTGVKNAGLENAGPNRMGRNRGTGKRGTKFSRVEKAGPPSMERHCPAETVNIGLTVNSGTLQMAQKCKHV